MCAAGWQYAKETLTSLQHLGLSFLLPLTCVLAQVWQGEPQSILTLKWTEEGDLVGAAFPLVLVLSILV